jgi:hypothetical protein
MPPRARSPNGHGPPGRLPHPDLTPQTPEPRSVKASGSSYAQGIDPLDLRGYERLKLITDLAMDYLSEREIAEKEGVSARQVIAFKHQYVDEIAEVRAALTGQTAIETAGLWTTKKQYRLAEYQDQIEEIRTQLAELSGQPWTRSRRDMTRTLLELFRQVADELGAYPQRSTPPARQGQAVHYVIETEDNEALQ